MENVNAIAPLPILILKGFYKQFKNSMYQIIAYMILDCSAQLQEFHIKFESNKSTFMIHGRTYAVHALRISVSFFSFDAFTLCMYSSKIAL